MCDIGRSWYLLLLSALGDVPQWAWPRIPPADHLRTLRALGVTWHRRNAVAQVNKRRVFARLEAVLRQRPVQVQLLFVRFVRVIEHDLGFGGRRARTPGRRHPSRGGRAGALAAFWTRTTLVLTELIFLLLFLIVSEPRVVKRLVLPALVFNRVGDPLRGDYFNPAVPQGAFVFRLGTNRYLSNASPHASSRLKKTDKRSYRVVNTTGANCFFFPPTVRNKKFLILFPPPPQGSTNRIDSNP